MMVLVNQAYDTLMDPAKREHYDLTGEEKPLSSIDIEARNSILQLFGGLLSQGKINVPTRAKQIANQALAKIKHELTEHRRQYDILQKRRDEVSCTDEENLWVRLVDSTLEQARGQISLIERKQEIATRVTEMLQAYRSGVVESANTHSDLAAMATMFREAMKNRQTGF
jgi:hypothetical protein